MAKCGRGYQISLSWVPLNGSDVLKNAICVGDDMFVCRGKVPGVVPMEVVPGKYSEMNNCAYGPYKGKEHMMHEYEILCDTSIGAASSIPYQWIGKRDGNVPENAVVASVNSEGNPLYIAKANVKGEWCVGKLQDGDSCAHFPNGGNVEAVAVYKVLVWGNELPTDPSTCPTDED